MGASVSTRALDEFEDALTDGQTTLVIRNQDLLMIPPSVIAKAIHLRELTLNGTRLGTLPASFGCLAQLERLSLDHNDLQTLPLSFHELTKLRYLDLSKNQLEGLYGNFCNLQQLEQLWLHSNELVRLPVEFGNLMNLRVLDIHNNKLKKLPKSFPCLRDLTRLDVSANKLKTLPAAFGNLQRLAVCNLSRNSLRDLPERFGMLGESLRVLFLQQNCLIRLPTSFQELTQLENLALTGNKVDVFPHKIFRHLTQLKMLSYGENRLKHWENHQELDEKEGGQFDKDLNYGLFELHAIQYLNFGENLLKKLPAAPKWHELIHLVELKLCDNKLTQLPSTLAGCKQLRHLDLSRNKLANLPESLMTLQELIKLNVQDNALTELPANIGECTGLKQLWIAKNPFLETLPDGICKLAGLEWLQMDKKCFFALDTKHMAFCEQLHTLMAE